MIAYLGTNPAALASGVPDASPLADSFHVMPGSTLSFGRNARCGVAIRSGQLSQVHALIVFDPALAGQVVLVDVGSRNGTWLGGQRVSVALLETGDEFELARAYRFRFEFVG